MKRHPALQDLSRDHFTALNHVVQIRRIAEEDRFARPLGEVAREFVDFVDRELLLHFDEEEETLVPHLAEAPELARRLLEDHAALRDALDRLLGMRDDWDLDTSWEVAQALERHIRWEENELFALLQESLDEKTLQALSDDSEAFRLRTRGAAAIGPGRA